MSREARILAASGLRFESHIAEHSSGVIGVAGGGDARRLEQRLAAAAERGICGVMSFGIAGALDPRLKSGDVLVGTEVRSGGDRLAADPKWVARIRTRLADAMPARALGSDVAILSAAEKGERFEATGCRIVDMESHIAARFALAQRLPFAVLRVVADEAGSRLPPAALAAMSPDGSTDLRAVLRSLALRPQQLPALIRLGAATAKARASLVRCVHLLGPGLGGLDLR